MNIYGFKCSSDFKEKIQSNKVDSKYSYTSFLLDICVYILDSEPTCINDKENIDYCDIVLVKKDKMSRVLIKSNCSIHSFSFPFEVFIDKRKINLVYSRKKLLRMYFEFVRDTATSYKKGLKETQLFEVTSLYDTIKDSSELIENFGKSERKSILNIIEVVYTYESAYFRFDNDENLENGLLHPANHFDFFFSKKSKLKVGSFSNLSIRELLSFINNSDPRHISLMPSKKVGMLYKFSRLIKQ